MAMDIPPMEDVVYALMQHLVVPWLPSVSFVRETHEAPSLSEQETVAKQVHAVVVLYNYYHKKQQPNAEILHFRLFCQLAVIIKHSLMGHLKIMHYADLSKIDDVENHLSLTEKAVMSALDISTALDPSKNFPSIENWEVSGVAVLLVNSTQEKCFLQYGSVIKGVWSLIERDIQVQGAKNERIKRKRRDNKSQVDKPALLPLALSAVEEETGMNANVVLESHTVYSLSREKRAVQFYIVQSVQSIDKDFHPIKDVVERLQGPLFRTRDYSWEATALVEYFHLLPYAEVIKAWFSRSLKSKPGFEAKEHNQNVDDSLVQKNDSGTKVGLQYVYENNSQIHPQEHNKNVVDHPSMVDCHTNQQTMNVDDSLVQMNDSGTVGLGLENANENKFQIHPQELNQDVGDNPSMVDFHTKEQTMDVDDSLVQKNDSGTEGLRLENVNENISQIRPKEHSQDDGDHPSMIDCHSNQQTMDIDDSLVQKNDSGTKVGLQVVIDNNSQISPKEHNQDVDDTSMVVCQTNQQTMDADDPSIVHEICKQTNANKIDVESSKKVINNGNAMIGLDECHTDQQIMDTDKKSMPNGKTNSDSNGSNQSGISFGFLEQISEKPNLDGGDSSTVQLQNGNKEKNDGPLIVYSRRKKRSSNIKANGKTDDLKADEVNKTQIIKGSGPIGRVMGDQSNTECQTMLQVSQVPKKLLQILLKVLLRKKTKLAHQLRELEGEIAVCEKSIQTIMDGKIEGEDEVEAILNFIDVSYKGEAEAQVRVSQQSGIQVQPILERKKLPDAVIPSLDPCQQLDVICDTNCWSLPTYQVYPVEGRYRASIKLEGADFEYCEEGNLCVKKSLARESVAGKMIAKLQSVSGKSH